MKKIELTKSPTDEKLEALGHAIGQHWLRYVALSVTAILTGYAGFSYTGNLFFSIALVALAEGASLYWAARIEDFGNRVQQIAAILGTVIAWLSIATTDLASVTIIAHGAQLFTIFESVPVLAQEIAVFVLPCLAVVQGTLGTLHYFFSEEARVNRDLNKVLREANKEIAEANAAAKTTIARNHAEQYKKRATLEAPAIGLRLGDAAWQAHAGQFDARSAYNSETEAVEAGVPFGSNGKGQK